MTQVSHHQTSLGSTIVRIEDNLVIVVIHGIILEIHIGCHLDELRIGLAQVTHKEVVACSCTTLVEIHDGLFLVHADIVETFWLGRILIEQHIVRLGRANLVIVYLLHLVDIRELLALLRGIVGTVVEAVAQPAGSRELRPFDMVAGQLSRLHVDDIELLPVAARA